MSTNLRNIFGTVVHDVPQGTSPVELRQFFGTVVHDVPDGTSPVELRQFFGTVIHDVNIPFNVSDITGTVGVSASFDGTTLGYSTSSYNFQWAWQAVPGGSSITNQTYPLPDNNENTYFNMTDNKGLWHFEGNADDTSGYGRDGTPNNASLVAGKVGSQSYQFIDTDDSYINFGQASVFLSTSSPFSVAIWIKGDSGYTPAQYDSILGFSNAFNWTQGMGIYWDDATTIRGFINVYNQDPVDGTITNVEEWNHIVMTYDQTDLKMYINGSLTQTQDRSITLNGLSNNLQVGRLGNYGRLEASLDEFAIWERSLSDLEVNNLYFLQSGSLAADLVGNVGLGETFTFVPDVTGTFTTNLTVTDGTYDLSGNVNAVISSAGPEPGPLPPIISGSNPTTELITANQLGYSINTYNIDLLSVQRTRRVKQIPFRLGGKGIQSLRLRPNTEITGSS